MILTEKSDSKLALYLRYLSSMYLVLRSICSWLTFNFSFSRCPIISPHQSLNCQLLKMWWIRGLRLWSGPLLIIARLVVELSLYPSSVGYASLVCDGFNYMFVWPQAKETALNTKRSVPAKVDYNHQIDSTASRTYKGVERKAHQPKSKVCLVCSLFGFLKESPKKRTKFSAF